MSDRTNDDLWDPELGAWVPRPSLLGTLLAGVIYGLIAGLLVGIFLAHNVLAASPAAAEPIPVVRSQPEAPLSLPGSDPAGPRGDGGSIPQVVQGGASRSPAVEPILPPAAAPIEGTATWYCSSRSACTRGYGPGDLVAAIDQTTGIRRGEAIRVSSGPRSITVTVVDVCACPGRRVIDLTSGAFRRLAPLSRGVIPVVLERQSDAATLPPTDEGGHR